MKQLVSWTKIQKIYNASLSFGKLWPGVDGYNVEVIQRHALDVTKHALVSLTSVHFAQPRWIIVLRRDILRKENLQFSMHFFFHSYAIYAISKLPSQVNSQQRQTWLT